MAFPNFLFKPNQFEKPYRHFISKMSNQVEQQLSLFRSQVKNRRLNDGALRILELVLVSKDVKSLLEVRSSLREFLRSESVSVMREIGERTVEQKLLVLEFFVRAFALVSDVESCMALRYEALVLRELKCTNCLWLQVSYKEWMTYAEQSLENGYYSIAAKACDNALVCLQRKDVGDCKTNKLTENVQVIDKIKRLRNVAVASAAQHSVQAQAAKYLCKKTIEKSKGHTAVPKQTQCLASTLFRNGIKKRNVRKLNEFRRLKQINGQSDATQF